MSKNYSVASRRRLLKSFQWLKQEENGRISKVAIKWLLALILPFFGFTAKGLFDAYKKTHPTDAILQNYISAHLPFLVGDSGQLDSFLLGALLALLVLVIILTVFSIVVLLQAWRSTHLARLPEDRYSKPSKTAQLLVNRMGESPEDYKIVGGVVEIARHPFIVSDPGISGWDCMETHNDEGGIRIEHDFGLPLAVDETLIAGIEAPNGTNNKKYTLSETPVDYLDAASSLCLKLRSSDYYTVKKFAALIHGDSNTSVRHSLASLLPEFQKIPGSLCLHFLLQLADGSLLCMLRRGNSDYSRGQISITGEEQFSKEDMDAGPDHAMNHWFRRALCEEIFPLRATNSGMLERNWNEIKVFVQSMRVYSVFYEEEYANYSIYGYAKLDLDPTEFKIKFEELARTHASGRDKEGKYYLLSREQAINFAVNGKGTLSSVWGDDAAIEFGDEQLYRPHSTSRYRILTFLLSVGAIGGRKSITSTVDGTGKLIAKLSTEISKVKAERDVLKLALKQLQTKSAPK